MFSIYSSKFFNQTDTICLDYEINDGVTGDVKCWESSSFLERCIRFMFEVARSKNLRLRFQVNGDANEYDDVLMELQSVSVKKDTIPLS